MDDRWMEPSQGARPNDYRDEAIDALLKSPFVAQLERHRRGAFHLTPEYFDDKLLEFTFEENSEVWLDQLHAARGRTSLAAGFVRGRTTTRSREKSRPGDVQIPRSPPAQESLRRLSSAKCAT